MCKCRRNSFNEEDCLRLNKLTVWLNILYYLVRISALNSGNTLLYVVSLLLQKSCLQLTKQKFHENATIVYLRSNELIKLQTKITKQDKIKVITNTAVKNSFLWYISRIGKQAVYEIALAKR